MDSIALACYANADWVERIAPETVLKWVSKAK